MAKRENSARQVPYWHLAYGLRSRAPPSSLLTESRLEGGE
jgi:hypothetical protein